jgi:hypothetical protein
MPEKPHHPLSTPPVFRPRDYDREQLVRAREVIDLARKILAESDPSNLLGRAILLGRNAESDSAENE